MSGKIYTMKEMKTIVEYLAEHKAYGEVKGRKMWMDFANSSMTNRTWQSLKETFLKRILPDIHNPYYGLSRDQIFSFRQGYDIKERDQNKLEIETVGDDSNSNGENPKNIEKHIVSSTDNGEQQGEANKCAQVTSKIRSSRDSPEPHCYKTVDDIRRDLESPKVAEEKKGKGLNSEKIPPVIQNVLNDFASDSEDTNKVGNETCVAEIHENTDVEPTKNNSEDNAIANDKNNIETLDTNAVGKDKEVVSDLNEANAESNTDVVKNKEANSNDSIKEPCVETSSDKLNSEKGNNKDQEDQKVNDVESKSANKEVVGKDESHDILETTAQDKNNDVTPDDKKENQEVPKKSLTHNSQNLASTNSDSILPNNQEGLEGDSKTQNKTNDIENGNDTNTMSSRKRGSSMDTVILEKKRSRKNSQPTTSEQKNKDDSESDDNLSDLEVFNVDDSTDLEAGLTTPLGDESITTHKNGMKIVNIAPENQNPCLKSVSLFAEQFNKTKYSDSSCNEEPKTKSDDPQPSGSKQVNNAPSNANNDDVVVLKSHSESDSNEEPQVKKQKVSDRVTRTQDKREKEKQREKAFANVFGFAHGGNTSNSKRKSSHNRGRRPTNTKKNAETSCNEQKRHMECNDSESDSSGWTTETEQGNFVLPPRGRRSRHSKKYLKPKSTRILSLEEEGGLFVMYGKRIYPIVKDGRIVKNYVIYESNSDSGFDQESYWKVKYAELKKKYEEHKKRKEESERAREQRQSPVAEEPSSPILQSNTRKPPPTPQKQDIEAPSTSKFIAPIDKRESLPSCPAENNNSNNKITIKYIVNNAEVQLEGHWPQICPIFDKVVNILPNKPEPQVIEPKVKQIEEPEQPKVIVLSGESTPVHGRDDAAARVEKLESEIFKEIAEKDNEEEVQNEKEQKQTEKPQEQNTNVSTRKRGRKPKQSKTPEAQKSPRKQPRISDKEVTPMREVQATKSPDVKDNAESPAQRSPNVIARRTRRSMKAGNEAEKIEEPKQNVSPKETSAIKTSKSDSKARYMLPPTSTVKTRRSGSRTPSASRAPKPRSFIDQVAFEKDDTIEMSESTQGYQDSDFSPLQLKKKKKTKLPTVTYRNKLQLKRNQKRRSPYLLQEVSTDSSNSSICSIPKKITSQNSSEIYKSESYQFLFPRSRISTRLEPIHEISPTVNDIAMSPNDGVFRNPLNIDVMETDPNVMQNIIDGGSSSNVSLPQSPELSVVEDISIGKDFLNSIREFHALKNMQATENDIQMRDDQSKYVITDVDITLPLMQQICELQKSSSVPAIKNTSQRNKKSSISESLINKICTVNINDNSSISDSLDMQLRDLLLESAKKMSKVAQTKDSMEVDDKELFSKKKKRCSTPRKRKEIRKSLLPTTEATVEQHMESCTYGGRKSCPPLIQEHYENSVDCGEIHLEDEIVHNNKPKGRRKKDVIKVKILRPRKKSNSSDKTEKSAQRISRMSICTDSGINGTASGTSFPISTDSVELIHNHSETCLHANECVDNSVEFINTATSIISLNSNSISTDWQDTRELKNSENISQCLLNNNNEDFVLSCNNGKCIESNTNDSKSDTIYRSPANTELLNNSLITEDLSDDSPTRSRVPPLPSRWYLLSEDETTNTNFVPPQVPNTGGFGSNLNQIFPITCAVPDLSTITEMSRENDSRRPMFGLDSFTRDSDSQNIFL